MNNQKKLRHLNQVIYEYRIGKALSIGTSKKDYDAESKVPFDGGG